MWEPAGGKQYAVGSGERKAFFTQPKNTFAEFVRVLNKPKVETEVRIQNREDRRHGEDNQEIFFKRSAAGSRRQGVLDSSEFRIQDSGSGKTSVCLVQNEP